MVTRTSSSRSSYPPTRLAFHASRIVIDAGVLLVLGAMSLPFVTAEDFGQRAVAADALPALLLILPIFVITLLPDQTRPIPTALGWLSLLLAATALPYAVVKYFDASTLAGTLRGSVGMGARILVLGAFVTLGGIVLGLVRNFLGLPAGGTYPARPELTAAEAAARGRHPATLPPTAHPAPRTANPGPAPTRRGSAPLPRRCRRPAAGPACRCSTTARGRPAVPGDAPAAGPASPDGQGCSAATGPRHLGPRHGAHPAGGEAGPLVAGRPRRPPLLSRAPVAAS